MTCPRCNTEWDVSKSPCPLCGLLVHVPGRSGTRSTTSIERGVPPTSQLPRVTQTTQLSGMATSGQQFDRTSPINSNSVDGMHSIPPPSTGGQQSLPIQPQWDQFGTPSSPSMNAIPIMSRPATTSASEYTNNPYLGQLRRNDTYEPGSFVPLTGEIAGGTNVPTRNVPHRPQVQPSNNRSTENLFSDAKRAIHPSHLTTDALAKEKRQSLPSTPLPSLGHVPTLPQNVSQVELPQLVPGTLLRGGRYRLRDLQERQDWSKGVFEATWLAQDAQRSGSRVMVSELVIPDSKSMVMQSTLRNATMALTSVGRHPHIPTLWDAFSDQGRNFFVFEPVEGESLAAYMRRTGRALPEHDVIECCLQMTEILEILVQQSPSFVHGLIRPEHIIIARTGSDYILTNFSIVLAGGATQFIAGIDHSHLTPYIAPEFVYGTIDVRSDLYSLLATAYHAATGSLPINAGASIPQAQRLNPTVSAAFDAILARGLRPIASQRYQRPSELRQDLLAMRSTNGTQIASNASHTEPDMPKAERPVAIQTTRTTAPARASNPLSQVLPPVASSILEEQEQKVLLPRPDELPAMQEHNDARQTALWLVAILLCFVIIVIISRSFM